MIRIENNCVGCTELGLHCMPGCTKRAEEAYYCDRCGEEVDPGDLFDVDGEAICFECRLEMLNEEEEEEYLECCV